MIPVLDGPWRDAGHIPFGYGDSSAVRGGLGRDFEGVSAFSSGYAGCRCRSAPHVRRGISAFPAGSGPLGRTLPGVGATAAAAITPGELMRPLAALRSARGARPGVAPAVSSGLAARAG